MSSREGFSLTGNYENHHEIAEAVKPGGWGWHDRQSTNRSLTSVFLFILRGPFRADPQSKGVLSMRSSCFSDDLGVLMLCNADQTSAHSLKTPQNRSQERCWRGIASDLLSFDITKCAHGLGSRTKMRCHHAERAHATKAESNGCECNSPTGLKPAPSTS